MNPTISLTMIVRNEEENLARCLDSVTGEVDEIVIVDTGSTDKTVEVARRYADKVYFFHWAGDFSAARNYALSRANSRWIFYLDADEELDTPAGGLRNLVSGDGGIEAFLLPLHNRTGDFSGDYGRSMVLRLFRNSPEYFFLGKIHEQVVVARPESVGIAPGPVIWHRPVPARELKRKQGRNLAMLRRAAAEDPSNPFLQYYLGLEWLGLGKAKLALPCFEEACRQLTDGHILFRSPAILCLISCLKVLGRLDEAIRACLEESSRYPLFTDLFKEAIEYYHRALSSNPDYIYPAYNLFLLYLAHQGPRGAFKTLVVDTGSSDRTREIARQSGARVFDYPWDGDFASARNYSLSQAVYDWILVLDADEMLDPVGPEEFAALLSSPGVEGYFINIRSYVALIVTAGLPDVYHCDENTHYWRKDLIRKVAGSKDQLIEIAREGKFDFLFLVDSDLVIHPKTLVHLAGLGKDIVSEVFWTSWEPGMPPLPQVWLGGGYRLYHLLGPGEKPGEIEINRRTKEFLDMLRRPGTYRVGGLGACTLISRKALRLGVSFGEIYNLDLTGEDRRFCVRAAALGLELYADTHFPPYHIYRESELAGLTAYKTKHFPAGGAPPPGDLPNASASQAEKGKKGQPDYPGHAGQK